jgi:hypothetical protein
MLHTIVGTTMISLLLSFLFLSSLVISSSFHDCHSFYVDAYISILQSLTRSGCLAGSSPALSVDVHDRCRCDFSTRSNVSFFLSLLLFLFCFSLFSMISILYPRSFSQHCLLLLAPQQTQLHIGFYLPRCSSEDVNEQCLIYHHLNLKKN